MPPQRLLRLLLLVAALLPVSALAGPYKGPFTGLFYGQGRGCWGELFIQTKTLTWLPASWTTCQRTTYTIVDNTLHTPFQNWDHIVFKLDHLSKSCDIQYVELQYFHTDDSASESGLFYDWVAVGFLDYQDYKKFPQTSDDAYDMSRDLLCSLPYLDKPFPYGSPAG